jgi:hypothetical protein
MRASGFYSVSTWFRRIAGTEVHMLKLYAVKVWRTSEPRNCEDVEVRTYTPLPLDQDPLGALWPADHVLSDHDERHQQELNEIGQEQPKHEPHPKR